MAANVHVEANKQNKLTQTMTLDGIPVPSAPHHYEAKSVTRVHVNTILLEGSKLERRIV